MRYFLNLLIAALSGWVSLVAGQEILFPDRYEIEHNEPVYYQELLDQMVFSHSWERAGQHDFQAWQEEGRRLIRECAGWLPSFDEFSYEMTAEEQRDNYRVKQIRLNLSLYSRVTGYVLVPEGEGPFPALVMLHDHGAEFSIGKEKMVKPLGVTPAVEQKARNWVDKYYEGRFLADHFAANGYVVFVTDALYWGERGSREGSTTIAQQALAANLMQMGSSWAGYILADDIRSVQFLAELPFVDSARIGAVGFSMGGLRSWMLSAVDERLAATASICWMNTTRQMMQPGSHLLKGTSAYSMLLPGLKRYMDYPDVASLTAPRPLLLFSGLQDPLFERQGTEDAWQVMRPVWESQGAGDRLLTRWWDVPHVFNRAMQQEVLFFFDKHLKKQ